MRFGIVVVLLAVVAESAVSAGPLRRYRPTRNVSAVPSQAAVQENNSSSIRPTEPKPLNPKLTKSVDDALEEVNAERARRGLRPFLADPLLTQAARSCAKIRATNLIKGHLASDFVHVPAGASAAAAGCGALDPSWGWGTCCTYENYTYAGAAWVMGADGRRYMHLFVR